VIIAVFEFLRRFCRIFCNPFPVFDAGDTLGSVRLREVCGDFVTRLPDHIGKIEDLNFGMFKIRVMGFGIDDIFTEFLGILFLCKRCIVDLQRRKNLRFLFYLRGSGVIPSLECL